MIMRQADIRSIAVILSAVLLLSFHSCGSDFNPFSEARTNRYSLFGFECGGYKFTQLYTATMYGSSTYVVWNTVTRNDSTHIILCAETEIRERIGPETGVPCVDSLLISIGNRRVCVWLDIPYEQAESGTIIELNNPYNEIRIDDCVWSVDEHGFPEQHFINHMYPITSCKVTIGEKTSKVAQVSIPSAINGTFTASFAVGCAGESETVLIDNGIFMLVEDYYGGRNGNYTYEKWQSSEKRSSSQPSFIR